MVDFIFSFLLENWIVIGFSVGSFALGGVIGYKTGIQSRTNQAMTGGDGAVQTQIGSIVNVGKANGR